MVIGEIGRIGIGKIGKNYRNYKRSIISLVVLLGVVCIGVICYFSIKAITRRITQDKNEQIGAVSQENKKLKDTNKSLEEKLAKLSADYEKIYKDRENIIAQSKKIIQEKNELLDFKKSFEEISEEKETLLQGKQQLAQEIEKLNVMLAEIEAKHNKELALEGERFDACQKELAEKEKLLLSPDSARTKISGLSRENKDLNRKVSNLERERDSLEGQLQRDQKAHEEKELASKARYDQLHNMYDDLMEKYRKIVQEQRTTQQTLDEFPRKIANLAAVNKKLLKETSDMHYNMGVSYFERREYRRALPEFERAIEISPEDAEPYYYLGYIYAEFYFRREKATEYFKEYLEYLHTESIPSGVKNIC